MTGGATFSEAGEAGGAGDGPPPLVAVRDVARFFPTASGPVRALDGVSLEIAAGTVFTLLGPSGCGKTTLLRLIAGFEHPDRGDVLLDGRSMLGQPPNRRPVNTVFQSYALFPHMSVADNVAFGLRNLPGGRPDAASLRRRVEEALALVRLEELAGRRPSALSGGQQQRVALARALAPRPRLVLLDEPLSALDPRLRRGMQVELKRIQRESGIAFLLVTHDREEAFSLSDRVAVMEAGRIAQLGAPRDIAERPASRFVAGFTGSNVIEKGWIERAGAGHAAAGVATGAAAVRPERVAVRRPGSPAPGGLVLRGRVASLVYLGGRTACAVALDGGGAIVAERDDLPDALETGDAVECRIGFDGLVPLRD